MKSASGQLVGIGMAVGGLLFAVMPGAVISAEWIWTGVAISGIGIAIFGLFTARRLSSKGAR